jgi:hypothetical protein
MENPIQQYATAVTADQRGNRIANRTPWLSLPAPFDNLEIQAWLDYPKDVADLWTPKDGETVQERSKRVMSACQSVFLAHRGADGGPWEDEDGVLPGPEIEEFWNRISTPLGSAIVTAFFAEISGNPTSRVSRRHKKRR